MYLEQIKVLQGKEQVQVLVRELQQHELLTVIIQDHKALHVLHTIDQREQRLLQQGIIGQQVQVVQVVIVLVHQEHLLIHQIDHLDLQVRVHQDQEVLILQKDQVVRLVVQVLEDHLVHQIDQVRVQVQVQQDQVLEAAAKEKVEEEDNNAIIRESFII